MARSSLGMKTCYVQHRSNLIFATITTIFLIIMAVVVVKYRLGNRDAPSAKASAISIFLSNSSSHPVTDSEPGYAQSDPHLQLNCQIKRIVIAQTVTLNCSDAVSCKEKVLAIQKIEMTSDWNDLGSRFLVGRDGRVYEPHGLNAGNHTPNNHTSICISFIGEFSKYEAPELQLKAAERFIKDGVKSRKIHPQYHLYGLRQLIPTLSPGEMLYHQIIKWERWSEAVIELQNCTREDD